MISVLNSLKQNWQIQLANILTINSPGKTKTRLRASSLSWKGSSVRHRTRDCFFSRLEFHFSKNSTIYPKQLLINDSAQKLPNLLPHTTTSPFPQTRCKPQIHPVTPPAGLRDLHSAHHDRLGQALVWRADGAQGSSEKPSLSGGEWSRGQGQAVQLGVGAFPERPVDQRPLPLKWLLLTRLCGGGRTGRGELWFHIETKSICLSLFTRLECNCKREAYVMFL